MEGHLILCHAPLGIYRDTVSRHFGKGVLLCAPIVSEPAEEDITVEFRLVVIRFSLSVRGNVRVVIYQIRLVQLTSGGLLCQSSGSVDVDTVKVSDMLL